MSDIVERLKRQAMSRMFRSQELSDGTMIWHPMMLEAADEITRLRAENETLRRDVRTAVMGDSAELADVKRENEKLREALKPFAYYALQIPDDISDTCSASGTVGDLRAAAAAIRESGDE